LDAFAAQRHEKALKNAAQRRAATPNNNTVLRNRNASQDVPSRNFSEKATTRIVALHETRTLANYGDAAAQFNLGFMYDKGQGVPEDYKEAVKWWRLAADQGYALAQYNLGMKYHHGRDVPQDHKEAVKWYRLAADQGDANAQKSLRELGID